MSLKKKIALSFFISAFIIAILAAFVYVNFVELKKEVRYLEITDTIGRKSLQLRRHEKNFLLYSPQKGDEESAAVHAYIGGLKDILARNPRIDEADKLALRGSVAEYERRFTVIEGSVKRLTGLFERMKASSPRNGKFLSLVEATFLERPAQSAESLAKESLLPRGHALIAGLKLLDADLLSLRKTGEDILVISKDLDKVARERAETVIRVSQIAILVFFPLFFIVGLGMLFKFNDMEDQLALREAELGRKNAELVQTKKLAAIGTLASGVAHELNNPLNNIYLSARTLAREAGEGCTPGMKEAVGDIVGQTERVKRIVSDLLEFARGREPQLRETDLRGLIADAFRRLGGTRNTAKVRFSLEGAPGPVPLLADRGQMEQVFDNLFANAVDAMDGQGGLTVTLSDAPGAVAVTVADTGRGIPREALDKIFEPFYTTKDKGTGLGLAIVYNIVKKHGGDITAASGEGKGTAFTITVPRRRQL